MKNQLLTRLVAVLMIALAAASSLEAAAGGARADDSSVPAGAIQRGSDSDQGPHDSTHHSGSGDHCTHAHNFTFVFAGFLLNTSMVPTAAVGVAFSTHPDPVRLRPTRPPIA